ncbi:MAG: hypothetical protein KAH17_00355 [Bacteroidales bacterium]|nr:hypothetical protein [Bacteroidales bacterium]
MTTKKKNTLQKISIVIHLISLVGWTLVFSPFTKALPEIWAKNLFLISLGICALSSYFSFRKTGLLKFTHTKTQDLDERELAVTNDAIRFGYSALAITASILLFVIALTSWQIHVTHAAFILYFSHVLPAIYLGWKGEER